MIESKVAFKLLWAYEHGKGQTQRMKRRVAGFLMAMCLILVCFRPTSVAAQASAPAEGPNTAAEDKEGCIRNLKIIYDAIQAYRVDHKDIPNWLSDLVPQYISDANVLICPACKRTGQIESALADPKLPCSYLYEFCPLPLGKDAPGDPTKTRQDWKRRQMGIAGSIVPIVRCRHHSTVLNLAFDGRIYESTNSWEDVLTNQMNVAELEPSRIFASAPAPRAAPSAMTYPPRDPQASPALVDLSAYYNASLSESWHGNGRNDLSSLPSGVQSFDGVDYDVRGIVQLGSKALSNKHFPPRVDGIKIHQKCARLHFLHATGYGSLNNDGEQVGTYIIHYATNKMQLEIPIIYGRDVRNWHAFASEKPAQDLAVVAWTGTNEASAAAHSALRLFTTTWINFVPNVEIDSIDFVSAMGRPAPFLVAITAE